MMNSSTTDGRVTSMDRPDVQQFSGRIAVSETSVTLCIPPLLSSRLWRSNARVSSLLS